MNINTFIFDLGGVIIDLDEANCYDSFSRLTGFEPNVIRNSVYNSNVFQQYEKGLIDDGEFRAEVNSLFNVELNENEIDLAWNVMLKEIPLGRLELLLALKEKYKVIILSNTNAIHINKFNEILKDVSGKKSLEAFANHVFFSYQLNMRKPDLEIYQEVLRLSKTNASEALFMDDKLENLNGALSVGINTFHITEPNKIFDLQKYV